MSDVIPEHLRPALARFQDAIGTLRTTRLRAEQLVVPPLDPPDPRLLEQAASRPDAPEQLKAVLRAVREGRTSWAEVTAGHGLDVPEIRDLISASGPRMLEKLAEAEAAPGVPADPAARQTGPRRARPDDWDEDDLRDESYLY